jgi:hypothetical protein
MRSAPWRASSKSSCFALSTGPGASFSSRTPKSSSALNTMTQRTWYVASLAHAEIAARKSQPAVLSAGTPTWCRYAAFHARSCAKSGPSAASGTPSSSTAGFHSCLEIPRAIRASAWFAV